MTALEMTPLVSGAIGLWAVTGGLILGLNPENRQVSPLTWKRFAPWTHWVAMWVLMTLMWVATLVFHVDLPGGIWVKVGFWVSMIATLLFPSALTRGWVTLGATMVLGIFFMDSEIAISQATWMAFGLCLPKLAAPWLLAPQGEGCSNCWQELMAPLALLGALSWVYAVSDYSNTVPMHMLSLMVVTIAWTLRVVTSLPQLSQLSPKWVLPLATSAAGGLMLLTVTSNLLLKPGMAMWSLWFGLGVLLMATISCLSACHANDDEPKSFARLYWPMGALGLLGLAALLLTRLVGPFGWVLLSAAAVSCLGFTKGTRWVMLAALFAVGKLWMMSLVNVTNASVSGVNLMHTYTTAGMIAGLAAVWLLPTWMRSFTSMPAMAWSMLVGVLLIPPALNLFAHTEPSQSFYLAFGASALVCGFLPLHARDESTWPMYEGMMVLGVFLPISSLAWDALYELGNTATRTDQLWALLATLVLVVVGVLLPSWMPKQPVSAS